MILALVMFTLVEELGSSQSGGTEQGVLVGKRDGLMRLLARREI